MENRFRNQTISLVVHKKNWAFFWTFPFHLCLLMVYFNHELRNFGLENHRMVW